MFVRIKDSFLLNVMTTLYKEEESVDTSNIIYKLVIFPTEVLYILLPYLILTKRKFEDYKDIIRMIVYVVVVSIVAIWVKKEVVYGYHTIIILSFCSILISILYKSRIYVSFISTIISSIYLLIFELIGLIIATKVLGVDMFNPINIEKYGTWTFVTIRTIQGVILGNIFKIKHKLKIFFSSKSEDNILAYNVLAVFLIATLSLNLQSKISKYGEIYGTNMLIYFVFIGFILINIIEYRKKIELINIKHKYEVREEYIENLQTVVDIVRKEKHDFANIINTVYAQSVLNKEDSLKKIREYLKSTINSLEKINIFYDTGNTYVDGLLAVKSNSVIKNQINLDVDFEVSLEFLEFSDNDLIAIISNIIDNAINALNHIETKEKKVISFYGYEENNKYYLAISNNGPKISKGNIDKIFQKGYSTRRTNKDEHGYGLYIVKELVAKNGGNITVASDEASTEFLLELKLSKKYKEYSYIAVEHFKI
jgi:signal transduction histidine kinase